MGFKRSEVQILSPRPKTKKLLQTDLWELFVPETAALAAALHRFSAESTVEQCQFATDYGQSG